MSTCLIPKTLEELGEALGQLTGKSLVLAGGTDLILQMRAKHLEPDVLLSLSDVSALQDIVITPERAVIGAMATMARVKEATDGLSDLQALADAAGGVGSPQIRNKGTIGGNVCNGITSADTASTLVALDAVLRVRGPKGEREVPISQWYQGVGKVALAPYELLVKIVIPYDNYVGYTGHYIKYAQRNAMDIATLGVSCLVKLTSDKKMVDDAALAFGVAGPVPMRSPAAEAAVRGLPIGVTVAAIGEAALADVNPRTSWRASKEFRIQLVKELSARSLREAARKGGADV